MDWLAHHPSWGDIIKAIVGTYLVVELICAVGDWLVERRAQRKRIIRPGDEEWR